MLVATQGIVFKTIKYSETSLIAKIFTEQLGLRSYIINGVRTPKGRNKAAMLQPLNQLDLIVYEKENRDLHRIKEMKFAQIYTQIPFQIVKTSIALFYAELFYKTVKEETTNQALYNFIQLSINELETANNKKVANLPIYTMLSLCDYLGFSPDNNRSDIYNRFDLKEGNFTAHFSNKDNIVEETISFQFSKLLELEIENWHEILRTRQERKSIIKLMQNYYAWHIENFSFLQSVKVLESIF